MLAMIKCLPKEVQGKLRSGVTLPSLQQCVEELVVNSIDAGATCVGVRMDMDAFKVQVIDNGQGINDEDMARVGQRYYTSKCHSLEDLEDLRFYGFRGEALASIVSLASLVEISSRTKLSAKTHVKIFREGESLDVFEAETTRPSAGTTVTVCNFLHNMPVRRKRLDAMLENERIRQRVEAVSLMHPSISFTLKNDCTGAMVVQLPKARNTYYRFVQIHGLARAQKLGEINHTHGQFEVTGYFGQEGHYNNSLQFLYVNERLLLKTRIHKLLNGLLRRLSSSNLKKESPEVHPTTRSPKQKRTQDLYGVFVVNVKCPYSEYDICLEPAKTLIEFKDWDGVLRCMEDTVNIFLKREDLVAELSQDDMEWESPHTDVKDSSQTNAQPGKCNSPCHFPKVESSIEMALSSKSVYRTHTNKSGDQLDSKDSNEKQNCPERSTEESKQNPPEPHCGEVEKISEAKSKISVQQLDSRKENPSHHIEKDPKASTYLNSNLIVPNNNPLPVSVEVCNRRKVTLSEPYLHKSLQIEQPHENSTFQQVELSCVPKRKISLCAVSKTHCEERFEEPAPVKIRKIVSLSSISQSLDQFRRKYGESGPILPVNSCSVSNSEGINYEKKGNTTDPANPKEENVNSPPNLPSLTAFTQIKPVTVNKGKTSLAAKLCHLNQQNKKQPSITQCPTKEPDKDISGGSTLESEHPCSAEPESAHCEEEERTAPDEWIPHYDSAVGKTVYVNKLTGLSSYEEPSAEQTETRCTSDVSNMAVSVMSEAGEDENSNSLYSVYSKWSNPVYARPPKICLDISRGQADGLSVKVHSILFPYRFTKAMIPTMKVLNQVDKKFLACLIDTRENLDNGVSTGNLLVLMDQHAAHERVRLENLIADAYEDDPDLPGQKRLSSSIISPPLEINVPQEDQRLLSSCKAHLRSLGLEVIFSQDDDFRVFIGKVPLCFTEKDINERRRGRPSVIKPLVEEYLREQIELLRSAGRLRASLPLTVQKVLASFACHGAIKFNDILNKNECVSLVASLGACQLPFQCAHGRPSIAPLVDLHHLDKEKEIPRPNLSKLRRMYKAWQLFGDG